MKQYPSIINAGGQKHFAIPGAYIFDKIDGNNLRFEYSKKRGWYKFGSRTQLINESTEQFEGAIPYFMDNLAEDILKINPKAQHIVAFCEWAGPYSIAGMHRQGDSMSLSLFDICVDKRGFVPPQDFVKQYVDKIQTPDFLGVHNFTRGLVEKVAEGGFSGVTFEGVVAKSTKGRSQLIMGKAKTNEWKEAVRKLFSGQNAESIINS